MADMYGVVILQGHLGKSSKNQGCFCYRSPTEPFFPQASLSINFTVTSLRSHSLIIHKTPVNPNAQAPSQLSLVVVNFLTVSRA